MVMKFENKEVTIMRNRGSVVIIENKQVALIKRRKGNSVYYVFPGGGIEIGETPEEGAKRETLEELGVEVQIDDCIAEVNYHGIQYYFLAEIIGGVFGTGEGEEYKDHTKNRETYLPIWVDINKLLSMNVIPREVAMKIEAMY